MEKIDGPTPAGGVYMEIYYFNDKRILVDKEIASKYIIKEFSADKKLIKTTYGNYDPGLVLGDRETLERNK